MLTEKKDGVNCSEDRSRDKTPGAGLQTGAVHGGQGKTKEAVQTDQSDHSRLIGGWGFCFLGFFFLSKLYLNILSQMTMSSNPIHKLITEFIF